VVAVGAQDQKCAAYGVGLDEGVMSISLGTAAAISKRWNKAKTEIDAGGCWCSYVLPDTFVTEGIIGTAGTCLRWTRDMLFKGESYSIIDEEAKAARDRGSSLLFFPDLAGTSTSDLSEKEGCFYGASLSTVRGDFALAVMEGIAFRMRSILEAMKAYGNVHTLVLFGGGANSDLWCQIIADATGLTISIPNTTEAAGAGAARLAAMATGEYLPPLKSEKYYTPSSLAAEYDKKYQRFRAFEKKLWNK
jgi:xylulokinase